MDAKFAIKYHDCPISITFICFSIFTHTNFTFSPKLIPKMLPLFWKHAVLERWDKNRKCVKVELTSCTLGWSKFCHGFQTSYLNKAEYTANEVAFGWAGAIFEVTRPLGQEQWGQRNKTIKKSKVWPTDQATNQPTDRPTDKVGCRVACTRLKMRAKSKGIFLLTAME